MKKQTRKDRIDEHLGMKDGAERNFKQSLKDRRDEYKGEERHLKKVDRRRYKDEKHVRHYDEWGTMVPKNITIKDVSLDELI